jgi:hypothetical protein
MNEYIYIYIYKYKLSSIIYKYILITLLGTCKFNTMYIGKFDDFILCTVFIWGTLKVQKKQIHSTLIFCHLESSVIGYYKKKSCYGFCGNILNHILQTGGRAVIKCDMHVNVSSH